MSAETVTLRQDDVGVIVRVMLTFDQAADDFLGDCERRGALLVKRKTED